MKTKISRFEYAIMETATPEMCKDYEPMTEVEEREERQNKLLNQAKQLKIIREPENDGIND